MKYAHWIYRFILGSILSIVPVFSAWAQQDVVIVVDNSGSMRHNDPRRLTAEAVTSFLNSEVEDTRVAIIVFDKQAKLAAPLTLITDVTRPELVETVKRIDFRGQFTNTPEAMDRAVTELLRHGRPNVQKSILFITDGIVDTGDPASDRLMTEWMRQDLTKEAAAAHIRIYGIAFSEFMDDKLVQDITERTGGKSFVVLKAEELSGAFKQLTTVATAPEPTTPPSQQTPSPLQTPTSTPLAQQPSTVAIPRGEGTSSTGVKRLAPQLSVSTPNKPEHSSATIWIWSALGLIGGILLLLILAFVFVVTKSKQVGGQQAHRKRFVDEPLQIKAELRDLSGVTEKSSYTITGRSTVIGRALGGIVIPKQTIGRQHAVIEYRDFAYWLIDEQSVNGTFLNDRRLEGKQKLKHGDHIRLDQYEFEFILPEMSDQLSTVAISKDLFKDQEHTIAKHRAIPTPEQETRAGVRSVYRSNKEIDQFAESTREAYRGPPRPDQPYFPRGLAGRWSPKWVIWFASTLGALLLVGIGLAVGIYIIGSPAPSENKAPLVAQNSPEHRPPESRPTEALSQDGQSPSSSKLQANPAALHVDNMQKPPPIAPLVPTPPNEPSTASSSKKEGEEAMSKIEQSNIQPPTDPNASLALMDETEKVTPKIEHPKVQEPPPTPKPSKPVPMPPPPSPPQKKVTTPKPPVAKPSPPTPKPSEKKVSAKPPEVASKVPQPEKIAAAAPSKREPHGYAVGAKECNECHKPEYKVWQETVHYKSYREVHRKPEAKKILKAVGAKSMKRDVACYLCHYSRDQKAAQDSPRVSSGPSCESCHSPASEWLTIHNDYGGKDVKREQETPEHKAKRLKFIEENGPLWHHQVYRLAANCMQCHGLANPELDSDLLGKMLDADHPIEPDFEFIRYSQGSVRHRYYPYGSEVNQPLSKAETARLFIIGQAAKLISATQASSKSKHPRYTEAQKERAAQAKQALNRVNDIAAVKTLLSTPTEDNAIDLSKAIEKMDLSAKVSDLLPNEKDYK